MNKPEIPIEHDPVTWWREHYEGVPRQIVEFVGGDGIDLAGKMLADIGSGDGIIDLGMIHSVRPEHLTGFDIRPTDTDALRRSAEAAGIDTPFPTDDQLSFVQSGATQLPAPDHSFDFVFTWSVFEHVNRVDRMFHEVHRVLKEDGFFFLQIWPLFESRHGGHAWMAVPEPFAHLTHSPFEMRDELRGRQGTDPTRPADDEFESLNRLTLDQLQRAMLLAHLRISKVELISETVHIPPEVAHHSLADLAISGIKLMAVPF